MPGQRLSRSSEPEPVDSGSLTAGELEAMRRPLVEQRAAGRRSRSPAPLESAATRLAPLRAVGDLELVARLGIEEPEVEAEAGRPVGDRAEVSARVALGGVPAAVLEQDPARAGGVGVLGAADVDLAFDLSVAPQREPRDVDRAAVHRDGAGEGVGVGVAIERVVLGQRRLLVLRAEPAVLHLADEALVRLDHLVGRTVHRDAAAVEPDRPLAEPRHLVERVRDEQHARAALDQLAHPCRRAGEEVGIAGAEDLVDDQDLGLSRWSRSRTRGAPAFPASTP